LAGLKARGRAEAIKQGENTRDKTLGIHRKLLQHICLHLLETGSPLSYEQRAVILMLYHAVGRGGEVSTMNFDILWWCEDNETAPWTGWNKAKTGRSSEISIHPDHSSYRVCLVNALACYIITAGGKLSSSGPNKNPDEPDWVFPGYADLADGGALTKAGRILKNLVGEVEGLSEDHASHGLRAGPTDNMAKNRHCDLVVMISRGNWDWTGECQIFGYFTKRCHVARAGMCECPMKCTVVDHHILCFV